MKKKLIPFNIEQVEAGAKVVTESGLPVRIVDTNVAGEYPILGLIKKDGAEHPYLWTQNGFSNAGGSYSFDLFIDEEETERQERTQQENMENKKTSKSFFDAWRSIRFDVFAQAGAKIVTRCGRRVRIGFFDLKDEEHPIVGAVETDGGEVVCSFTKDGRRAVEDEESRNDAFKNVFDLFIEEEVEEEHNNFEITPDKWYLCTREACLWLKNKINYITFEEGVPYPGADILKCNLSYEPEFYQKYFKPWNICYAKPGDILASKNGTNILIFKQIESITSFSSYYNIQHRRDDCWANDCFMPATKEQYSQIFKKMKEDGYEWDSERNELKEIATDKAEEEDKTQRMTNRELAWWLRKCPEECREYKYKGCSNIHNTYNYYEDEADNPCLDVLIRSNGGEWKEPLV